MNTLSCDVLVCGGGVAGVTAAKVAMEQGSSVTLAVKGSFCAIGQRGAGASCCGSTEFGIPRFPSTIKESLFGDDLYEAIITAGLGVTNRSLAKVLVESIPKASSMCDDWNIRWGGTAPYTLGYPLVYEASRQLIHSGAILEHTTIVDLLYDDDHVVSGAYCICNNEPLLILAKAVIIATGGCAGLFAHHVHPSCLTGDGHTLVLKAGGSLINMEFAQLFPMTVTPTRNLFHFWSEESMRCLYNNQGERFLSNYLPQGISEEQCIRENISHAPFSTRDDASRYAAIAITEEIIAGRGGIYVDVRGKEDSLPSKQKAFFANRGISISSDIIEIAMGYQCSSGGVEINEKGETGIAGLYAAGEVTGGMHGADRLGGNMLASGVVWGAIAAQEAARYSKRQSSKSQKARRLPPHYQSCSGSFSRNLHEAFLEITQCASTNLLVTKSEIGLLRYLSEAKAIQEMLRHTQEGTIHQRMELEHVITIGQAIALSSLQRRESRGSFYRKDFPTLQTNHTPVAHRIRLKEDNLAVESVVLDPLWQEGKTQISLTRWG